MNSAQSLNGANINVGMTLYIKDYERIDAHYRLEVKSKEEMANGQILVHGVLTQIFDNGVRLPLTSNDWAILNPNEEYRVIN
jgi:hypothetical protein